MLHDKLLEVTKSFDTPNNIFASKEWKFENGSRIKKTFNDSDKFSVIDIEDVSDKRNSQKVV